MTNLLKKKQNFDYKTTLTEKIGKNLKTFLKSNPLR